MLPRHEFSDAVRTRCSVTSPHTIDGVSHFLRPSPCHTRCWCFCRSFVPLICTQCCFTQRSSNQHSILQEDSPRFQKLPASSIATLARNISLCATGVDEALSICRITNSEHWDLICHAISLPLCSQCHISYIRAR